MGNITLKTYRADDESKLIQMTESRYNATLADLSRDGISLIVKDGTEVGWVYLSLPESSLYSGFVFIYIVPEQRRKGIGTEVFSEIEKKLFEIGCNFWSSYPESDAADKFALSVGFDYTNTNSFLVHDGSIADGSDEGIRMCRIEDYPTAPDIWSKEYAAMHSRLGLPYPQKDLSDDERKEEFDEFCRNIANYFVLEQDGKIVGVGTLFGDNSGIGSLAVDNAYSGFGYGTRLALFLTNECIRRGCNAPCIYCESGNDNAMHVYKKIGYVEKSRETVAVKNKL